MNRKRKKISSQNFLVNFYRKIASLSIKQLAWGFLILFFLIYFSGEIWQAWRHSIWQRNRQLYLAVDDSRHMGLMRVDPQFSELKTIIIPEQMELNVAYGYGDYRADKLVFLANQEHIKYGEILQNSLTQTTGIITNGYITSTHPVNDLSRLFLLALFKQAKTNLTDWDLLKLLVFNSSLKYGQKNTIELNKTLSLKKVDLPDNTEVYKINKLELKRLMLTEMANPDLLNFTGTLEIFNGTQHSGWAQQIQYILSSSGFDVVGVRQAKQNYQQTKLTVNRDLYQQYAVKELVKYLGVKVDIATQNQRADMTLVLGEDLWKRYFSR